MNVEDDVTAGALDRSEISFADVRLALFGAFGIEAVTTHPLGGEIDHNVLVTDAQGRKFIVKLTPLPVSEPTILWQEAILEHLALHELPFAAPSAVRTTSGLLHSEVTIGGDSFIMRVLNWLEGEVLAKEDNQSPGLLRQLGRVAAQATVALSDLIAPADSEDHHWLVTRSRDSVQSSLGAVKDPIRRREVLTIMSWFAASERFFVNLPVATVHQDLNDFNVLVTTANGEEPEISGILDFNDARTTIRVAEVAVAVAYAMLRKVDPLAAAVEVVGGYNEINKLSPDEIRVIFPLAAARLCVNATTWTKRTTDENHEYGHARMNDTWPAIAQLAGLHPEIAEARFRQACGLPSVDPLYVLDLQPRQLPYPAVIDDVTYVSMDLTPASDLFDEIELDRESIENHLASVIARGNPGEVYFSPSFSALQSRAELRDVGSAEPDTVQLGTGLITGESRTLRAPCDAVVMAERSAEAPLILRHDSLSSVPIYSLWWGVESNLASGERVEEGQAFAVLPAFDNSRVDGLFSGLVQVFVDPGVLDWLPPRTIRPSEVGYWRQLSPDPAHLLSLPETGFSSRWRIKDVVDVRDHRLAPSQKSYFDRPMNLVRGRGVWLYDEDAFKYLDPINNVTHVGHAERRVAAAGARQMHRLNTNSRLVYSGISEYADRLTSTLSEGLDVVFFVCTGSEANDLALRIAKQVTGRKHAIVIDSAYHGNTTAVMEVSPNRYKAPGGGGTPENTREVMTPDRYRGPYGYDDPDSGKKYAQNVRDVVAKMMDEGTPPAAFIAESLVGTGGNYILPPDYLRESFEAVRSAGGLCITDEVQVGFGRLGSSFWGYETHGVVPDIVTMGKPMGNGHPMAAVVTTRAIAEAFDDGVKYFNTFGGNPVSCAIGMSVLDVIHDDSLQANAKKVGLHFRNELDKLKALHPLIGDVRGEGLYLGVEIVRDRATKAPGNREALLISEMLKDRGVIMYPNGRFNNVLKLKPPMVFTKEHVTVFVSRLDRVLTEVERTTSTLTDDQIEGP